MRIVTYLPVDVTWRLRLSIHAFNFEDSTAYLPFQPRPELITYFGSKGWLCMRGILLSRKASFLWYKRGQGRAFVWHSHRILQPLHLRSVLCVQSFSLSVLPFWLLELWLIRSPLLVSLSYIASSLLDVVLMLSTW